MSSSSQMYLSTAEDCPVKVYGLVGHSNYLSLELPADILHEGEVFGFQDKYYQVRSVLKDNNDEFCLNVNWIVGNA